MWLVICASDDAAALWASEGIKQRGPEPVQMLYSDSLLHGVGWEHRLQGERVFTDVTLPCGQHVRSSEVSGLLNRISALPPASLLLIQPSDRHYATHEFQALFLSWLQAMPAPVLNRPTPFGLSGRLRHVSEWVWLAANAGLPNRGYRQSSNDVPLEWGAHVRTVDAGTPTTTLIVVGDVVTGPPAPAHIESGCLRLSKLSGAPLLGVEFVVDRDQTWTFAGVSTNPDLRFGGEPLLDALALTLNGRTAEA
ncbi:MAG: hypothetical protein ACREX3_12210 [Gammaproteobacteria bacterium]